MKVRIEDQRIVYRLNENERNILRDLGVLSVETSFVDAKLKFQLVVNEDVAGLAYSFNDAVFTLIFPKKYLDQWEDEKVGFEEVVNGLTLVAEKDLKRSKRRN